MAYATWDPLNIGSNVSLSGGNLVLTNSNTGEGRANTYVAIGTKHYWEVTVGTSNNQVIGIDNGSGNLNGYTGSDANAWGLYSGGGLYNNSSNIGGGYPGYVTGNIIGIKLDLVGNTVEFLINNSSVGAPTSIPSANYYPAAGDGGSTSVATANFGASAFTYSVPAGFVGGVGSGSGAATVKVNDVYDEVIALAATTAATVQVNDVYNEVIGAISPLAPTIHVNDLYLEVIASQALGNVQTMPIICVMY